MQGNPHNVEGQPPEDDEGTVPGNGEENPERQGPDEDEGTSDAPSEPAGADEAPAGPPPESLPGEEAAGTSPRQ
jgi:hypothetical protein